MQKIIYRLDERGGPDWEISNQELSMLLAQDERKDRLSKIFTFISKIDEIAQTTTKLEGFTADLDPTAEYMPFAMQVAESYLKSHGWNVTKAVKAKLEENKIEFTHENITIASLPLEQGLTF